MADTTASGPVQYIVLTWVPEARQAEWLEWHTSVHVPDVLKAPMMRGAQIMRVADMSFPGDWQPQYATVYTLDSMADMDAYIAGPAVALREDHARIWGAVGKIARMILVAGQPQAG
jgi:hypothetical protein